MKSSLVLVMVSILMACLIAGCGGEVKTYIDATKTITTIVNQEFVIALDSDSTTDYSWMASYDDNMLSLVGKQYNPDEKAPGLVAAGGTQYFRFKALNTGMTEITVEYRRWEKESEELICEKCLTRVVFNVNIE